MVLDVDPLNLDGVKGIVLWELVKFILPLRKFKHIKQCQAIASVQEWLIKQQRLKQVHNDLLLGVLVQHMPHHKQELAYLIWSNLEEITVLIVFLDVFQELISDLKG